jgi:glutathione synthase
MKIGFLTTSISSTNEELTTHDLAFAALQRSHKVYFFTVFDMFVKDKKIYANARLVQKKEIETRIELGRQIKNIESEKLLLTELDVLLLRHKIDPSDKHHQFHKAAREYAFHLSEQGVKVWNNPKYLQFLSSKLAYLSLDPKILPKKQLVSASYNDLYYFCKDELIYEGVMKPLGGKGGENIYFTEKRNLQNNLKALLKYGPVLIQSYIPNTGDKRILLLNGEPIGQYLRVAKEGEFLNNIHSGGKAVKSELTDNDKKIIDHIKPVLKKYGMVFVGIDILGNYLSEINTENPGGTVRAERFGNFNSRERVIEWIENNI